MDLLSWLDERLREGWEWEGFGPAKTTEVAGLTSIGLHRGDVHLWGEGPGAETALHVLRAKWSARQRGRAA